VCVNAVFLLATHTCGHTAEQLPDEHATFERVIDVQNHVFTYELLFEVLLAFFALGPRAFASNGWIVFDFMVATGMVVGLVGRYASVGESARGVLFSFNNLARNMRVVRVLRVLTFLRITRGIIRTLITCIPKLANIILLVMLVYTIIAAVAVQWFGAVKYGSMLGPSVNFETFIQVCYASRGLSISWKNL